MTNEQILKKAIKKAVKNGFNFAKFLNNKKHTLIGASLGLSETTKEQWQILIEYKELIIFSHDFARAFWGKDYKYFKLWNKKGETKKCKILNKLDMKRDWQYHLQQMVLEEDPIKYLEKFI